MKKYEQQTLVFSTDNNKYIFDNISGSVFPYSDIDYYIIENFYNYSKESLLDLLPKVFNVEMNICQNEYLYISNLINMGYFYKVYDKSVNETIDCEISSYRLPMS